MINEHPIGAGDGVAVEASTALTLSGAADAELLLFDMGHVTTGEGK